MHGENISLEDELWKLIGQRERDPIGDNRPTVGEWIDAMESVKAQILDHGRETVRKRRAVKS